jgi:GWxTD domain-containing protein
MSYPKTALRLAIFSLFLTVASFLGFAQKAKQSLDPQDKPRKVKSEPDKAFKDWVTKDVTYIITGWERQAYDKLTSNEERERFIEEFWRRPDPDPDSEENEFREEYNERIVFANEHFASGIPGFKTDRGRIWIMYGKPDGRETHPMGGSYDRPVNEGGGSTTTYPFETWTYRYLPGAGSGTDIEFVDPTGSGEYRMARNGNEKDALLIVLTPAQDPATRSESSPIVVLSSKWARSRLTVAQANSAYIPPAPAMISANKIRERNRRADIPAGERDPNLDTIDGRAAALEKSVQDSRAPKPVEGFVYRLKVHNADTKVIEFLFWEYQFIDKSNTTPVSQRQFLCAVFVKPDKDKNVEAFSTSGPGDVISAGMLSKQSTDLFEEKVVINRVEYADGSVWQRKGWHLNDVRLAYERVLRTPWGSEMCRSL